jgi:hypothetical protein
MSGFPLFQYLANRFHANLERSVVCGCPSNGYV